jgi:ABC-type Mn2+/Zn2+ transport system permease subunit
VIRRGIVFSDLSLDQLAAFGMIVGIGIGIDGGTVGSYLISFVMVLIGSFLLAFLKPKNKQIPHEAVIGIIYGLALVASIMVADKIPSGASYVKQSLSGVMLWVNWTLVIITVITYIILAIIQYIIRHKIIAITEGHESVKNEGLWDLIFFISLGIITVLIVPIAGVLLAYGFLMIPAATATLFTKDWKRGLSLGWQLGFIASLVGLFSSYFFKLAYGPSLVLSLGLFFIIALFIKSMKKEKIT